MLVTPAAVPAGVVKRSWCVAALGSDEQAAQGTQEGCTRHAGGRSKVDWHTVSFGGAPWIHLAPPYHLHVCTVLIAQQIQELHLSDAAQL